MNNWWLDDNLSIWMKLFRIQKKAVPVSVKKYCEVQRKRKEMQEQNLAMNQAREKDLEMLKKIEVEKVIIFEDKENDIEVAI